MVPSLMAMVRFQRRSRVGGVEGVLVMTVCAAMFTVAAFVGSLLGAYALLWGWLLTFDGVVQRASTSLVAVAGCALAVVQWTWKRLE